MATLVLDLSAYPGTTFRDVWDHADTLQEDGPDEERILVASGIPRRVYSWPARGYPEEMDLLRQFAEARALDGSAFYVLDPWSNQRWDIEVGPSVGAQSVFSLPTSRALDTFRDYPVSGTVQATVAGVARAVSAVGTDARTVTLSSAASDGQAVKVSYQAYRLCRFPPGIDWEVDELQVFRSTIEVREVLRAL